MAPVTETAAQTPPDFIGRFEWDGNRVRAIYGPDAVATDWLATELDARNAVAAAVQNLGPKSEVSEGSAPKAVRQPPCGTEYEASDRCSVVERVRARLALGGAYVWLNRTDVEALLCGEGVWAVGLWLSAALDDPTVCDEMKADIREWFDGAGHIRAGDASVDNPQCSSSAVSK